MNLEPKIISNHDPVELNRIFQFRYKSYSVDTNWRPKNEIGMDYDDYDEGAIHLAQYMPGQPVTLPSNRTYDTIELATYHRLTPRISSDGSINPFMVEREYEEAMQRHGVTVINSPDVGEISRLCIHRRHRKDMIRFGHIEGNFLLSQYRVTYQACKQRGIKLLYFASTKHIIENGRKHGFPIHRMMPLIPLKNGDEIEFVQMHWDEFNQTAPAELVAWFNEPVEELQQGLLN